MQIDEYLVEKLVDPTGILTGNRYEFRLYVTLDEDDELYTEEGAGLRVLYKDDGDDKAVVSYHFFDRSTEKVLDFELEEEELELILEFCKTHLE